MSTHELKTWPEYYEAVLRGDKTFEVRADDRGGYAVGDVLVLHEWDRTDGYSGRRCDVVVKYVLRDARFGVAPGFAVMGITLPQWVVTRHRVAVSKLADVVAMVVVAASASLGATFLNTDNLEWMPAMVLMQFIAFALLVVAAAVRGRT